MKSAGHSCAEGWRRDFSSSCHVWIWDARPGGALENIFMTAPLPENILVMTKKIFGLFARKYLDRDQTHSPFSRENLGCNSEYFAWFGCLVEIWEVCVCGFCFH